MAKLSKDQYFYRELSASQRNHENAEIARGNGMSEEQINAVIDLCVLRHNFHCDIESVARLDADTQYKRKIVELNAELKRLGLPTISNVPTCKEDFLDIDDLDERITLAQEWNEMPDDKDYNSWVDDNLNEIMEQLYAVHKEMESCLAEIDKKYNTKFCPTGTLRL